MAESIVSRRVRVELADRDALQVPADVAAVLGGDADLEVGPGAVVTIRPAKLRQSDLAAMAAPIKDAGQLMPATTPLSDGERAALTAFLGE